LAEVRAKESTLQRATQRNDASPRHSLDTLYAAQRRPRCTPCREGDTPNPSPVYEVICLPERAKFCAGSNKLTEPRRCRATKIDDESAPYALTGSRLPPAVTAAAAAAVVTKTRGLGEGREGALR